MQLEDALTTVEHQLQVISLRFWLQIHRRSKRVAPSCATQQHSCHKSWNRFPGKVLRLLACKSACRSSALCSRFSVRAWPAWRPSPTGKPQVCYPPQMLPPHMEAPWAGAMPAVWPASTGLRAENLRRCAVVCAPGARWSATHPNKPPGSVAAHFCAKPGNRLAVQLAHP